MQMDLWFTEDNFGTVRYGYKVDKVLFSEKSEFQTVDVVHTAEFGNMMLLDGLVMVTDKDEFVYHEMISHIPVCLHGNPKDVIVIGGGDGGTVRELLRYPSVNKITLCEIDGLVIEAAKKFFPTIACGFYDSRVEVLVADGITYMADRKTKSTDLVLVDSTDPIGPGEGLFSSAFYKNVSRTLRDGGLMAAQSESPWYEKESLLRIKRNVSAGFSTIKNYVGAIPTYPRGYWAWTVAGNRPIQPTEYNREMFAQVKKDLMYLNDDLMVGAFAIPNFYAKKLEL